MANYNCSIRTNYFHVKDAEKFREFMNHVLGSEDNIDLWEKTDNSGCPVFGFGCYGSILGYVEGTDEDDEDFDADIAYDAFIDGLSNHVADDDAIIIFEAGNEKLRYVVGSALVITRFNTKYLDVQKMAVETAAKLLKNPEFDTQCEY